MNIYEIRDINGHETPIGFFTTMELAIEYLSKSNPLSIIEEDYRYDFEDPLQFDIYEHNLNQDINYISNVSKNVAAITYHFRCHGEDEDVFQMFTKYYNK
jgi:hypothetical protein